MNRRQLAVLAAAGMSLFALLVDRPVDADASDSKETCASKYPNAPTEAPRGYDYKNENDAYMALRRAARQAGYLVAKKAARADVTKGPCVGHGEHINIKGRKSKNATMVQIGSLTSCEVCKDTDRGPRLERAIWRIFKEF